MTLALAYAAAVLLLFCLACWPVDAWRSWRDTMPWPVACRDACGLFLTRLKVHICSRRARSLALALVAFHGCLYLKARVEWMGGDNGNKAAREYWVAGQGAFAWRALWMHLGGHPETRIMQPFVLLQRWIYHQGCRLLPERDGERGVWTDMWFVYPYSRNMLVTKDNLVGRTSAATTALLELAWQSLERQATGSYTDRKMRELYYRNFPRAAFYYNTYKHALNGRTFNSEKLHANNTKLIKRDRSLRRWLQKLPEEWNTSEETIRFVRNHPKIEAMRQLTILMASADILLGDIHSFNFSCDNPDVQEYLDARTDFLGDGTRLAARQRMRQQDQAQNMYEIGMDTLINRFSCFVIQCFCNTEIPGRKNALSSADERCSQKDWPLRATYSEELTILDTMFPDTPYGEGRAERYEKKHIEAKWKERKLRERIKADLQSRSSGEKNEAGP